MLKSRVKKTKTKQNKTKMHAMSDFKFLTSFKTLFSRVIPINLDEKKNKQNKTKQNKQTNKQKTIIFDHPMQNKLLFLLVERF